LKTKPLLIILAVFAFLIGLFFLGSYLVKNENQNLKNTDLIYSPNSMRKGSEKASVVVTEFFDPECESCREFQPYLNSLLNDYDGRIQLVLRYAPFHPNSIFAVKILEAARDEVFDDSILYNKKNEVTETAISNLILRIADQWVTPPITAGLLPGVVRAIAIEECGVKVRSIHISEIADIESAFLVSSLRLAQPISHIGEMKLKIGEASLELREQIIASSKPHSVG
jgi:thiol-disulfide isomerase/thioredoxin